jgi:ornithine cyclodeaminase
MEVLVINQSEVRQLLPMGECINLMAEAFKALARGDASNPPRQAMWLPDKTGLLGMMPACTGNSNLMGLKAVSVFPGNQGTEFDSHQGVVLLFETAHGRLLSILDATAITAIRTAAVSGAATRLLAREDADRLAILGSGVQARSHLEAMLLVRSIKQVKVWSRTYAHAVSFAKQIREQRGIQAEAIASAREAVEGTHLICTTTAASEPVLMGEWIASGAHINAVGSSTALARELDAAAVVKSRLFVDWRPSAVHEAGDFIVPKKDGIIGDDHIKGEIGEILLGRISGRESSEEITLFKSVGLAVEDVAAADYVYRKAVEGNKGLWVELGGQRC